MVEFLVSKLHDVRFMTMLLAAIAASATVYTLVMPLFAGEGLAKRMKAVASERERIRQRERERLNKSEKVSLRQTPKQVVSRVVEDFNLTKWLAQEAARDKLIMAGYRGQAPYITFLFARMVAPLVLFVGSIIYVFLIAHMQQSMPIKIGICIGAAYLGLQAPMLFLKNAISKRQLSIKRAFPDALDLLLICIESGMSVEMAFRKVATEIVGQSIALSEEFTLTTAELSYLQDRKVAYENLARRTGLEGVKSVCLALQQAERYGTPLGHSLRVMAQENRDMRMNEAEKKAAALPPKLTVPMILFFLPVLFVVILGPTGIKISELQLLLDADRARSAGSFRIARSGSDQSGWLSEATGVRFGAPRGASLRLSISLR
jgi:tight adherence protein C